MIRFRLKSLAILAFVAVFLLGAAGQASAKTRLVPKADSFIVFLDYSGSMAMKHQTLGEESIVLAKQFLKKFNAAVPEREYESRFYTFGPFEWKLGGTYDRAIMDRAIDGIATGYTVSGRLTPMGNGLMKLDTAVENMKKNIAVIVVSDGKNNLGHDPVEEAKNIYAAHPGQVCFHVVSFADTEDGQRVLDAIAGLNACSVSASGPELLASDMALKDFVQKVFFDEEEIMEEVKKEEPMQDIIPLRVNFDFDSSRIKEEMTPILDEAADIIKGKDKSVLLEGHTCNIGTEEYNKGLSDRRAKSVQKYLKDKGVPAERMSTMGLGESQPKYDNNTREGRKLNRRVEIIFQ
ncbi:OOP family OmpA-OmpF porin [Desulfobaculum xiamenense]|uniref:OOP family OmpA-OmpF porin n=1 Tax=Desulfobaculum xiamenense TaxID=995050 RepID=A0A846QCC6_9BACT|nr:OmpA family protein [Desulfobaculum xiamenense]NJB66366.1 OOP family OmpA-OmpF porin [Desulfobaculum xiamenense]